VRGGRSFTCIFAIEKENKKEGKRESRITRNVAEKKSASCLSLIEERKALLVEVWG